MFNRRLQFVEDHASRFVSDLTDPVDILTTKIMIKLVYESGCLSPRIMRYIRKRVKTAREFVNLRIEKDRNIGETSILRMKRIQEALKFYIS